ncbi:acyl-CoA dehydrogenase/oxidase [Xylaria nigripes]|nr:acyl-CoA dehydrogenase/oxidase [Xylaria nigripes]
MSAYSELLRHELFNTKVDYLHYPTPEETRLPYDRARLVCQKLGMTVEDVVNLRPKFWDFYRHSLFARDTAMGTTLAIHWNLCIGTIGAYVSHRPDLRPLLEKLINFDLNGQFLLTEISHGLDARNLETTATLQPDGSFDLHTPNANAAKAMPPITPWAGVGRVGVVFARLMVDGADHGVKTFIVHMSDENGLKPGITSKMLPKRCGAKAVDHAITTFIHVRLGPEALLGSTARAKNQRADFFFQIHRVPMGTLSLSMANIPALRVNALIAGTYSTRRRVAGGSNNEGVPIIQFPTQYRPILDAMVQSWVYDAFADDAIAMFLDKNLSMEARHGVAVCFKTSVGQTTQHSINEVTERCGWQGLFGYNQMIETGMAIRGNGIAEGDYTVLSIRLASELLLGRYKLPAPRMKTCALARYEAGLWQEARDTIASLDAEHHRSEEFNAHILPRCRDMVKATGQRMAYEAAVASGKLKPEALALFESSCMKADLSWYCQHEGLKRNEFLAKDAEIAKAALPLLKEFLADEEAIGAIVAPIMTEKTWSDFVSNLPTFTPASMERSRKSLSRL